VKTDPLARGDEPLRPSHVATAVDTDNAPDDVAVEAPDQAGAVFWIAAHLNRTAFARPSSHLDVAPALISPKPRQLRRFGVLSAQNGTNITRLHLGVAPRLGAGKVRAGLQCARNVADRVD
jgi:hypothetical protein